MKNSPQFKTLHSLLVTAFVVLTMAGLSMPLQAEESKDSVKQRSFASPEEAIKALIAAAQTEDKAGIDEIFGPEIHTLMTGDKVQDKANFEGFSKAVTEACVPEPEGPDKVILSIGKNQWPFPIPLVKRDGQWFFDTRAGKEEIINRHIGRDEFYAIGICRSYVKAQQQYYSKVRDDSGVSKYAMKFKSTPGKQDGLYWAATGEPSPFSAVVAEAHAEGYGNHPKGTGPHPFHGYFFRILTAQGRAATGGKMDYIVKGNLTGGFALVAYPEKWGKSGVMTFIVNQDGKVYQRNLDEKTERIAGGMTHYNPDGHWTLVSDLGLTEP